MKTITVNRKARHNYHILETVEAGLVLTGTEIKSIRAGRVSIAEAFARAQNDELWLYNAHIAEYPGASVNNHEPTRPRKLLLHYDEMRNLISKSEERGLALVPLRLYISNHRAKTELALAKGKKLYDKRRSIAEKDAQRNIQRAIRRRVGQLTS